MEKEAFDCFPRMHWNLRWTLFDSRGWVLVGAYQYQISHNY